MNTKETDVNTKDTNLVSADISQSVLITNPKQLSALSANSSATIGTDIDLQGKELSLQQGVSLNFSGGSLRNGTLRGNGTSLYGDVRVESLSGSFDTPVRASYLTAAGSYSALKALLELDAKTVILDTDFIISPTGSLQTINAASAEYIIGENISITVSASASYTNAPFLVTAGNLKHISGIAFDGGGKALTGFLEVRNDPQTNIDIEDIVVKNIVNPNDSGRIIGILVDKSTEGTDFTGNISVHNLHAANLLQRGDGGITNSEGSVYGLLVHTNSGSRTSVRIDGCTFSDIHCFGSGGTQNIVFEDAGGLFVWGSLPSDFTGDPAATTEISNVSGHNFGKRLVKTDCPNVSVRNILGTNEYTDFLCLVGLNSGSAKYRYASLKNIRYEGVVGYYGSYQGSFMIDISMDYTTAEDIVSKVTDIEPQERSGSTDIFYPYFYPANINADNVILRGVHMIGAQTVMLPQYRSVRLEDVTYDDTEGASISYSPGIFMPQKASSAVICGLKIKSLHKRRLVASNYPDETFTRCSIAIYGADMEFGETPANSNYKIKLVEAEDWGTDKGQILNLTMKDCIIRHSERFYHYPFRKFLGQWVLQDIVFLYDSVPANAEFEYFAGAFAIYGSVSNSLTLSGISVECASPGQGALSTKPAIFLNSSANDAVCSQVHLSNIRTNCTQRDISLANVCWHETAGATVHLAQYNLFGAAQKGFTVRAWDTGAWKSWNGSAWV